MKRIIVLLALSLGLSLWFIKFDLHIQAWASAGRATSKQLPLKQAGSIDRVTVRAAGRGNPLINLRDGIDLKTAYVGAAETRQPLEPGRSMPLALAVGDFDEDGVPDVIGGFADGRFEADSGVLALYRGNADSIYPNSPEAQKHKMSGEFTDSSFRPSARVFDLPEPPDYLGAGDFDADGHLDVVVAAACGQSLYVLSGDGRGGFHPARAMNLPGRLTALAAGEINRADGLTDIAVGVEGGDGPNLLVFEGPQGAFNSKPEVFQLRAEATALALGQLDDDYSLDLAVGAGSELLVLHGRDRKLSLDTTRRSEVQPAIISRQWLSFRVQSLAVGNFAGNDRTDIAVLSEDGKVCVLERTQDGSPTRKPEESDCKGVTGRNGDAETRNPPWRESSALSLPGSPRISGFAAPCLLVAARVSSLPTDDLVVLDRSNDQLHILTSDAETQRRNNQAIPSTLTSVRSLRVSASLDVEGEPMAVVPMRLNTDALNDLVILRAGAQSLTVTPSAPLSTITVNDTADTNVRDSVLTLREAIMLAEGTLLKSSLTLDEQAQVVGTPAASQEDEIRFDVPGAGAHTINPIPTGLPTITAAGGALIIDGTTQPGFAGMPLIELNGMGVVPNGLMVDAGNSTVRGLVINRFINGILVNANGNDVFEGNFIGTDVTGSADLGNSSSGILINRASNNTRIGGTTAAARNIISGNDGGGVAIFSSTGIMVQGNFIGTNVTGTAMLGNSGHGIRVSTANNNTTIGGTAAGALNLISGNIGTGLQIDGSNSGNLVQGNLIGTDITGTFDFGNQTGVAIGSANNTIGGTTAAARNLVSGNNNGVLLNGGGANANLVQGNFIGTDASGAADLGNSLFGVDINFGSGNTIGGTATGAGNLISGNNFHGLNLGGSGNFVQGNLIGTQQNGSSPLGNSLIGVLIGANNNAIGGIDPGAGNIIAFNGEDGVQVVGGSGHAIRHNSIFSNGTTIQHLGIDLGSSGVTANDPNPAGCPADGDTGPNNLQNFPVITSASLLTGSIRIEGTLNSTANTTFSLDFFSNPSCAVAGNGEGQTYLGSATVMTNASCVADFTGANAIVLAVTVPSGQRITATATDPAGNTSEFSSCSGPTAVEIVDFTATGNDGGHVVLEWHTGYEVDNLGFNLYREQAGRRERINPSLMAGSALLAGAGTQLMAGRSYSWWDEKSADCGLRIADCRDAQYWLEEIDLNGQSNWHGPVTIQRSPGSKQLSAFEPVQTMLLSRLGTQASEQATTSPVEPRAQLSISTLAQAAVQSDLSGGPAVKLSVKQGGWYRVSQQELVRAGLDAAVDPRRLQMFVDGRELPIAVAGEQDGRLDESDAVEFYGMGLDSPFDDARVYWLVAGSQPGKRIKQVQDRGSPIASRSFPYIVERKDRTIYFSALRNGERENFFGAVIAREPLDQSIFVQHLDSSSDEEAALEVTLQGVTFALHRIKALFNGKELGEIVFSGQTPGAATLRLPQSLIKEGQNSVTLIPQEGQSDVSLVDYMRLTYSHTYRADDDALRFTASGKQRVTIDGFTSGDIRVIDVSDPDAVQQLSGEIQQGKEGFTVTVTAPADGQRRLFAFTSEQSRMPGAITANQPSAWRRPQNGANLVIITHQRLSRSIEPLKAHRQSQGLSVAIVDVEDIFDEFSFGQKTPYAIRDFLAYARANWKKAPRYVLLAADASFDAKNYLGLGANDLVPTKLIDTLFMETASDDWFADFDGDGLAEMAVGRLPARTEAEAGAMISKIISYDSSPGAEEILLVSDSNEGFDFEAESDQLQALIPPNLRVGRIQRGRLDAVAARSLLFDRITRGQKIVNYTGHGSVDQWRGNLLTSTDARELANEKRLPMFVMMTCLNGYFHDAALDSLAEALLKAERGGAVAVWASSGLTMPFEQSLMNQELYRLIFTNGPALTLGDATVRAKAVISDGDIRRTWILFGDPVTRLR